MHRLITLLLTVSLLVAAPAMAADAASDTTRAPHRIMQLTGTLWMESGVDAKLAVLFGIELGMQSDIASKRPAPGKTLDPAVLSPFQKAWLDSFRDRDLTKIAAAIDAWYAANPDRLERPVMAVLWTDIMKQPVPARP